MTKPKPLNKEKDRRCPFCNINLVTPNEYKKGFRYYCASCDVCYNRPTIDEDDVLAAIEWLKQKELGKKGKIPCLTIGSDECYVFKRKDFEKAFGVGEK